VDGGETKKEDPSDRKPATNQPTNQPTGFANQTQTEPSQHQQKETTYKKQQQKQARQVIGKTRTKNKALRGRELNPAPEKESKPNPNQTEPNQPHTQFRRVFASDRKKVIGKTEIFGFEFTYQISRP